MISGKDKMIVEAVNSLEAVSPWPDMTTVFDMDNGCHAFGNKVTSDTVCTVNEYTECIKEMSEAKWMQKPVEELMLSAKESQVNKIYRDGMKLEVGMTCSINDKEYIVDYIGDNLSVLSLDGVSYQMSVCTKDIKPIKSKEELKIDKAKVKRLIELAEKYESEFDDYCNPNSAAYKFFKTMQDNGDLAEIILPLEK